MNRRQHYRDNQKKRFASHALVEIKKIKWLPFGAMSALLLDISLHGFKVELTKEHQIEELSQYWMTIPLSPFNLSSPSKITFQIETKWFDEESMRLGGVFLNLSKKQTLVINKIIELMKINGNLIPE